MSYQSTILADSPIRYYRLGESSGTVATDIGSQVQNGTLSGTITLSQPGLLVGDANTSMLFGGGSIALPTTGMPTNAVPWSAVAWVTLTAADSVYRSVLTFGTFTGTPHSGIRFDYGGGFGNAFALTNVNYSFSILSGALTAGTTYHLVGTYDGTTVTFFVNGTSVGTQVVTLTLGTALCNIGTNEAGNAWAGVIDEVSFYSTTLSTGQVAAHYTAGTTAPVILTPRFIGRALGATIIPEPIKQPLPYIRRAFGSTIIYENRTFVPRALGGVYMPDTVMWVPRALVSTEQFALLRSLTLAGVGTLTPTLSANTALSSTLAGVGTLAETLTLATALSDTLAGVGTLTGTLTLATALSTTIAGVGTLSGTLSANTALSTTDAGVGTLSGTLSANTALAAQLAGTGTLTGSLFAVSQPLPYIGRGLLSTIVYEQRTFIPRAIAGTYIPDTILPVPRALLSTIQATVGLSCTLVGVGTLTGVLSGPGVLTCTMAGVGTLTETLSLATSLTDTLAGVGTLTATLSLATALTETNTGIGQLSGTLAANTALSLSMAGVGTLAAQMSAHVILSTSLVGAGTLSGVFSLRVALSLTCAGAGTFISNLTITGTTIQFLTATWVTRDGNATWTTRDEQASWQTRDELVAAWKGR